MFQMRTTNLSIGQAVLHRSPFNFEDRFLNLQVHEVIHTFKLQPRIQITTYNRKKLIHSNLVHKLICYDAFTMNFTLMGHCSLTLLFAHC